MGKTDSIKQRRVDVYLDSLDRKERWSQLAEEADESLSKFVQQCVEYAIEQGGPDFAELGERGKKIQELEQQVKELRDEVKQKDIVIDKLEADLQRYRMGPFLDGDFEGVREYDQELIEILKDSGRVSSDELIRRLGVDQTDSEVMKGINAQLEQLESYGLVSHSNRGWMWVG